MTTLSAVLTSFSRKTQQEQQVHTLSTLCMLGSLEPKAGRCEIGWRQKNYGENWALTNETRLLRFTQCFCNFSSCKAVNVFSLSKNYSRCF